MPACSESAVVRSPYPSETEQAPCEHARALETRNVNRFLSPTPVRAATLALVAALSGCTITSSDGLFSDKIDYRSQAQKTQPLEVPPDLTQLSREGRFQPQNGIVSATNYTNPSTAPAAQAAATQTVAPNAVGDLKMERNGNTRWLLSSRTPEQLWPLIEAFWKQHGFNLVTDSPEAGVMETDWAENRAKLPNDIIRNTIGKVFGSLYDTGERDKFRTRLERTPQGTEIYISHRGFEEVVTGQAREGTLWQPRKPDPGLEAEMLARLMVQLGSKEQEARDAVTATAPTPSAAPGGTPAASGPARARLLSDQPGAALQVDEPFDRAWRRVGLALDRSGFTVEDRDRANGIYYVRYADPKTAGEEEPNFFQKLFGAKGADTAPHRYRIQVQRGTTDRTTVSVLDSQGQPEKSDIGKGIVQLLVDDLK